MPLLALFFLFTFDWSHSNRIVSLIFFPNRFLRKAYALKVASRSLIPMLRMMMQTTHAIGVSPSILLYLLNLTSESLIYLCEPDLHLVDPSVQSVLNLSEPLSLLLSDILYVLLWIIIF